MTTFLQEGRSKSRVRQNARPVLGSHAQKLQFKRGIYRMGKELNSHGQGRNQSRRQTDPRRR
nr:MAG TPA: hypothetical protein [Caudoviricetes sp.]